MAHQSLQDEAPTPWESRQVLQELGLPTPASHLTLYSVLCCVAPRTHQAFLYLWLLHILFFFPSGVLFHPLVHLVCLLLIFQDSTQSCSFWKALPDLRQRLAFLFQSSWDSLHFPLSALNTCSLIAIGLLWWAASDRMAHKNPCFLVFLLWSALPLSAGRAH